MHNEGYELCCPDGQPHRYQPSIASRIASVPQQHDNNNPLWQGPCDEGPLGGITQSMLVRFMSCRERFRLRYVLGLEPHDKWNKNLGYGNMWHVCEETLAGNEDWDDVLAEYTKQQMLAYPLQREEITKWYNVCCIQFPEYVQYWLQHPDVVGRQPLMQEQVFDVPYTLPSGRVVRLRGKFDSVDLINGGIWLQENKTKGDIDKLQVERQLKFDLQTLMYLVALGNQPMYDPPLGEYPIMGVRYNVIRRPLSGGKGSIVQKKGSKNVPAETEGQYYERLRRDYIAAEPEYWFFRVRVGVSTRDVQMFRVTCLNPLLEQLCCWYEQITRRWHDKEEDIVLPPMNYRTPFGVWSALEEGGATEYDSYLETGSEVGLRRTNKLFTELSDGMDTVGHPGDTV